MGGRALRTWLVSRRSVSFVTRLVKECKRSSRNGDIQTCPRVRERKENIVFRILIFVVVAFPGSATTFAANDGPENAAVDALIEHLTNEGLAIAGQQIKLNPVWLKDGISGEEQSRITDKIAGRRKKQFYRDSISATFESDIESIKVDGRRAGYAVDFAFIVYASLDDVLEKGADDKSGIDSLANESEMKVTELAPDTTQPKEESAESENTRLVHGQFTLLEKVLISSVVRTSMKRTEESITVAWEQDRAFDDAGEISNSWRFTDAPDPNKLAAYNGFAGYAKVTKLKARDGALLVEYHYAFAEPKEWSEERISLRAKLSIVLQESVRKARRQIRNMKKQAAAEH